MTIRKHFNVIVDDIFGRKLDFDLDVKTYCDYYELNITVDTCVDNKFTDDDIYLIMELLHKALDYGGSYNKMRKIVKLLDKLNEENTINE